MTDLLYQTDSYLREFSATVVALDAAAGRVALDRSAFYPGGGGQPGDVGTLTFDGMTVAVTQVKKEGDLVWHWLSGGLPAEGQAVTGSIDWDRRYALDAHAHRAAHPLRRRLAGLRRAGDRRQHGPAAGPDGLRVRDPPRRAGG